MQLKEYKLGDIGRVVTGKTPATSNNVNFEGGTIPFYTPEDVAKGFDIKSGNKRFITSLGFEEIKNNTIAGESVLVGCIGSDMGNVAYVNEICATNQQINSITDFKEFVEPLYVYYLLSTMKPIFRQLAGSTTTPILAKSVFENITISLPRLETQKRVCKILSSFDSKIVLNRQINQNLEALARQLYDYWFVQFDFPNEEGKPYKSSGGKMVYDPILKREIPEGWEVIHLKDVIHHINTGLNPRNNFTFGGNIKYITVKNLTTNGNIDFSGCDTIDEEAREKVHKRSQIAVGDILYASICPLGRTYLISDEPNDWDINESVFSIRPNHSKITSEYLNMLLKDEYYISKLSNSSTGSIFLGIRIKQLEATNILLPNLDVLNEFSEQLKHIFRLLSNNFNEIEALTKQRDELLPLLMNGQVNFDLSAY